MNDGGDADSCPSCDLPLVVPCKAEAIEIVTSRAVRDRSATVYALWFAIATLSATAIAGTGYLLWPKQGGTSPLRSGEVVINVAEDPFGPQLQPEVPLPQEMFGAEDGTARAGRLYHGPLTSDNVVRVLASASMKSWLATDDDMRSAFCLFYLEGRQDNNLFGVDPELMRHGLDSVGPIDARLEVVANQVFYFASGIKAHQKALAQLEGKSP